MIDANDNPNRKDKTMKPYYAHNRANGYPLNLGMHPDEDSALAALSALVDRSIFAWSYDQTELDNLLEQKEIYISNNRNH